jgi:O-phosphoseryl-tRNA(Cys) synthetase
MGMIPKRTVPLETNDSDRPRTSRTYRLDPERGRIAGIVDGADAVRQFVYKALSTERFAHAIYSGAFGHEIVPGLDRALVVAELPRWIEEALLQDDRVAAIRDMELNAEGDQMNVRFTVVSVFGEWEERRSFDV